MILSARTLLGADKEGFVARETLRKAAAAGPLDAFAQQYPVPGLLVVDIAAGAPGGDPDATARPGPQLMTMLHAGTSAFRYLDQVGFLVKRPGSPFPQFISIGRAPNNDIVFAVDSVSKFHAYFWLENERWLLTDSRSTNGSRLNDNVLEPSAPVAVNDRDRIRFGDQVTVEFLLPQTLYLRMKP